MAEFNLPDWKDLPPVKGMPHGCAWGVWDQNGEKDQLGSLNLLTPQNTLNAKAEIKHGISVSLNWGMECIHDPGFNRKPLDHTLRDLEPTYKAFDDEINLNTQAGSQWDGFRHWAHQPTGVFYNGLTKDEILDKGNLRNGIQEWSKNGGLVGRGVLIDYVAWAEKNGIKYEAPSSHEITYDVVEQIAKDEGIEFRRGDILMIRSGWVKWYNQASTEERLRGAKHGHNYVGFRGSEASLEWLWNHHFAALVGDAIAFECWPANLPWRIHDFALPLWGTPLGEMWDLERLAEVCKEKKKWSFFFTSSPLNVAGGIASPPNALAIL